MLRVAVLDDYQGVALNHPAWSVLGDDVEVVAFSDHLADADELVARLAGFEIIVLMRERTPMPAKLLGRLPRLRLLITSGPQNASIDLAAATAHGIALCGTDLSSVPTAELAWALIMAVRRNLLGEDAAVRAGRWQTGVAPELAGSTLGLLGLGRLGTRIAQLAGAFDMNVIAWTPTLDATRAGAAGVTAAGFDELFEASDILSIHVRYSPAVRGLVGTRELALLGPRSHLVNTSRGPIVDEAALVAALHSGAIAGAALDVYDQEPLPADHPLRRTPNTLLSPHVGYVGTANYATIYRQVVEDIVAWRAGEPIRVIGSALAS